MKTIKFLALFTLLSAVFFASCSDNESIENQAVTQKSTALRMMFNEIKKTNNVAGKMVVFSEASSSTEETMSFDFVYPITVSYNNGTVVTVTSLAGLLELISSESNELYISGIEFPFQIVVGPENTIITIDDETEFWEVIEDMDIETYDTYVFSGACFELAYPVSFVLSNNQIITVPNQNALYELFTDPDQSTVIYDFVYPFNVTIDDQIVVINNIFEFDELSIGCIDTTGCICPEIYDPVCVSLGSGAIMQYANACFATCDGYTEEDFVDCDDYVYGEISVFLNLGTCFNIEYPVQMIVLGEVTTVNDDVQLLEYLFELENDASIVYPINVTVSETDTTYTFQNQTSLSDTLNAICD